MDRLLAGRPQRTDGRLIKDNLWKEADVSRATMNRATQILAEWDTRVDRLRRIHARRGPQERRTSHPANKTRGQDSRVHGSCTINSTPPPPRSPPCITTTSYYVKNLSKAANSPSYKSTADAKFPSSGRCLIDPNAHRLRRSNGPSLISQNATDPMSHETHGFWRTSSLRIYYNNSPFLKS